MSSAQALTFKSGQVLGSDGQIYDGASPEQAANIAKKATQPDLFGNTKTAGVLGQNVFVVVQGRTTFIPIDTIRGKSPAEVEEIIVNAVIANLDIPIDPTLPTDGSTTTVGTAGVDDLTAPDEVIATQAQIDAANAQISAADTAGIAQITEGFAADISVEDLQEATRYATEFAAREAANIAAQQAVQAAVEATAAAEQAVQQAAQAARVAAGEVIENVDYSVPDASVCEQAASEGVSLGGC